MVLSSYAGVTMPSAALAGSNPCRSPTRTPAAITIIMTSPPREFHHRDVVQDRAGTPRNQAHEAHTAVARQAGEHQILSCEDLVAGRAWIRLELNPARDTRRAGRR